MTWANSLTDLYLNQITLKDIMTGYPDIKYYSGNMEIVREIYLPPQEYNENIIMVGKPHESASGL